MAEITDLLRAMKDGDAQASRKLIELVYHDMRRMARQRLRGNRLQHELGTTSLAHEAIMRMAERDALGVSDRRALFAYIARTLRSVMVDHARRHAAKKRGGPRNALPWSTTIEQQQLAPDRVLVIDQALEALERSDPALHRLAELRYFAGMSIAEVAALDGSSPRTVHREWQRARARLRELLDEQDVA